jgi:cell division protease FtsH
MADATASIIDGEVRRIVDEAYTTATKILKKHGVELERLAQGLLEYETLDGEEIKIIVEGGTLVRKDADDTPAKSSPIRKSRTGLPGTGRPKKAGGEPA